MNLINDEQKILLWAEKEQNEQMTERIFPIIDTSRKSYYERRTGTDLLIHEYDFDSFAGLKDQLDLMWQEEEYMQEMTRICTVVTMKNKPIENEVGVSSDRFIENYEIPDYVYVF